MLYGFGAAKEELFKIVKKNILVDCRYPHLRGKRSRRQAKICFLRARFVGEAYEDALDLEDKDRIIIQSGIVDNVYNKEKEKLYVTVTIFRFENDEEATS